MPRVTVLSAAQTGKPERFFDTHFVISASRRAESADGRQMKRIAGEKAAVFLRRPGPTHDNALLDPLKAWMQSARHAAVTDELPTFNDFGKAFALWIDFIFRHPTPYRALATGPQCRFRALAFRSLRPQSVYALQAL